MSYKANGIDGEIKVKAISSEDEQIRFDIVETGDDKGVRYTGGQFSVEDGEFILGQDSYSVELAYHYDVANETAGVITSATDISTILQSDNSSTTPMFEANTTGQIILVGAENPFFGVKIKYDSLGSFEPDRGVGEFLDNTDTWVANTFMVANAEEPHTQNGWNVASYINEHVRFGQSLVETSTWGKQTLTINGTPLTKYWIRFRLITPVTTMPVMEKLKHHTTRIEQENDIIEFFGNARRAFTLLSGLDRITPDASSTPSNTNVTYFTDGVAGYVRNTFSNNSRDSFSVVVPFEEGLDTSTPIVLQASFYVDGIQTGDIEFEVAYQQITDGFLYNTSLSPDGAIEQIYPIITPSQNERNTVRIEVPINEIGGSGGGVVLFFSRDARVSNPDDTLAQDIVFTNIDVIARRWRL